MMRIRFTRHALEKFTVLRRHGVFVSREKVLRTIAFPDTIDYRRDPLLIAQGDLDTTHVLRVVYRIEGATRVVITFYPGRKSQYEN